MSEPTKRTFDEIRNQLTALDMLYAMFAIDDSGYERQKESLRLEADELKGLSDNEQESTD